MADLNAAIPRGATVGLDTVTFIYHIEQSPAYAEVVGPLFVALEQGYFRAVTSVITLLEIAVGPFQLQRPDVAATYELLLTRYPNLTMRDVDRDVAREAARLRAQHGVGVADSLQLATALEAGASRFVTNDRRLARVRGLPLLFIDDYRAAP
jgi:predicted nucleic acid-binding protein